jgi:chaperonin GroES
MKFSPAGDNIVVKTLNRPEQTRGGLYIPNVGTDGVVIEGEVIAVGAGRILQNGNIVKCLLNKGDRIWFPKFNATEVEVDGEKIFVVSEQYVLGYHSELPL